jgi:hypothetical protein
LGGQRDHHCWELRALRLVDGHGVGERNLNHRPSDFDSDYSPGL